MAFIVSFHSHVHVLNFLISGEIVQKSALRGGTATRLMTPQYFSWMSQRVPDVVSAVAARFECAGLSGSAEVLLFLYSSFNPETLSSAKVTNRSFTSC
jgi:hypothetical protein